MTEADTLFADLVVAQGIATRERVTECLAELQRIRKSGGARVPTLGELLVRRGYLTADSLRKTRAAAEAPVGAEMPPEAVEAARLPDRVLGRYVIVSKLGAGGMGEVWKAWDRDLARWVALKFLKHGEAGVFQRFRAEAQASASLTHANIAAIYDVGETNKRAYIAMQYVKGMSLAEIERDDPRRLVTWIRDAALAVDFAHEHGVIHRDLKPGNLMTEGDRVFVMDFGLARRQNVKGSMTQSGVAVGTPVYMPPEQAAGEKADRRSDVYSLGATLYDLLTGRPPFDGQTALEIIIGVLEGDFRPPRKINPRIDSDLETIVLKCMEMEQGRRYPTAKALADDLTRWLDGDAILARPASPVYRVRKYVARRKAKVAAVVLAVLLAGGVSLYWFAIRPSAAALTQEAEVFGTIRAKLQDLPPTRDGFRRGIELLSVGLAKCPSSTDGWLRKGELHEKLGEADEALGCYAAALKLVPKLVAAFYRRGRVFKDLKRDLKAAQQEFEQAAQLEAGDELVLVASAELRILAKDYVAALDILKRAEKSGAYLAELHLLRALVLQDPDGGFYNEAKAMEELNESLRLEPTLSALYNRGCLRLAMARALRRRGKLKETDDLLAVAEHDFALVLQRHPKQDAALHNRANVYALLADLRPKRRAEFLKAERADLDASIAAAPKRPESWISRALVRRDEGDFDGAIADLNEAIALDDAKAGAYSNLSVTRHILSERLQAEGRPAEAKAELTRALDASDRAVGLEPKGAKLYVNRAVIRRAAGDRDGAIADLEKAILYDPNLAEAHVEFGNALTENATRLHKAGRSSECLDECRKAIASLDLGIACDVTLAGAYTSRARARALTGDALSASGDRIAAVPYWQTALDDQVRAIDLGAVDAGAYYQTGRLRFLLGYADKAIADYTESLRLDPQHKASANNRGLIHRDCGEAEKAIADFTLAIEADRSYYDAIMNRAATRTNYGMQLDTSGKREQASQVWSDALQDYNRCGALRPNDPQLYANRGILLAFIGLLDRSEADLSRAIELDAKAYAAFAQRASVRLALDKYAESASDAETALKLAPPDWYARESVKQILEKAKRGKP